MPNVRRVLLLALAVVAPVLAAGPAAVADPSAEAATVLIAQVDAWNRGDLEAFTALYADDCTFVSPTGITRGRSEVLERYRGRYPDRAAMGTLTLDVEERRVLAESATDPRTAVAVVARWTLSYPGDSGREDATGFTLVILERGAGGAWTIVQDASM